MRNRIVAVSYLNTIPFIYGIEHAGIDLYADLLLSPPRGCASLLRDGGAEIALIPVAAVPSIPDIRIVTPFCIGASRSVRTVVLAADSPLDRLDTIYLDSHSLTSVRLVRILASKLWGIRPEWKELKDFSALNAPQPRTGYLIIGDKVFDHEEKFRYRGFLSLSRRGWRVPAWTTGPSNGSPRRSITASGTFPKRSLVTVTATEVMLTIT